MTFNAFKNRILLYTNNYLKIIEDSRRVKNYDKLIKHIEQFQLTWTTDSAQTVRQITETFNEICIIHHLITNEICTIIYEPLVGFSGRSIDLLVEYSDKNVYMDIKTIHPQNIDKWDEYIEESSKGFIDGLVLLYKDGNGGFNWHKMKASRSKFLEYAINLEDKIRELGDEKCLYFMIYCGNGNDWHVDQLEDFVEFYHTGMFIGYDHFRTMSVHYNNNNDIQLNKSIHSFIMLKRDEWSEEYKIYPHVRAPDNFKYYISP